MEEKDVLQKVPGELDFPPILSKKTWEA